MATPNDVQQYPFSDALTLPGCSSPTRLAKDMSKGFIKFSALCQSCVKLENANGDATNHFYLVLSELCFGLK